MSDNSTNRRFVDTNVLTYGLTSDKQCREVVSQIAAEGGTISVQVLNELTHVYRRKHRLETVKIIEILAEIRSVFTVVPLDLETHDLGLHIMQRYRYSVYDSMIIASALEAGCTTLLTEDLAAGQILDGRLTIINPFTQPG